MVSNAQIQTPNSQIGFQIATADTQTRHPKSIDAAYEMQVSTNAKAFNISMI